MTAEAAGEICNDQCAQPPAPRAWQRMLSGRRLDLLDPSPLDIEIEDIAHGIARVPRWNGQTKGAHIFSVAQHTLLVDTHRAPAGARLDDKLRLAVMLHDAPEYVVGDMISPFKAVIGDSYKAVEQRLLAAIHLRFGLPPKLPAQHERMHQGTPTAPRPISRRRGLPVSTRPRRASSSAAAEAFARAGRDYLTPWPAENGGSALSGAVRLTLSQRAVKLALSPA